MEGNEKEIAQCRCEQAKTGGGPMPMLPSQESSEVYELIPLEFESGTNTDSDQEDEVVDGIINRSLYSQEAMPSCSWLREKGETTVRNSSTATKNFNSECPRIGASTSTTEAESPRNGGKCHEGSKRNYLIHYHQSYKYYIHDNLIEAILRMQKMFDIKHNFYKKFQNLKAEECPTIGDGASSREAETPRNRKTATKGHNSGEKSRDLHLEKNSRLTTKEFELKRNKFLYGKNEREGECKEGRRTRTPPDGEKIKNTRAAAEGRGTEVETEIYGRRK